MALSELDWMANAHPDWEHIGYNGQKHPMYEKLDVNGNKHRIVGFEGIGHTTGKMLPLPQLQNHLNSYIYKCENGACYHIYNVPQSEEPQEVPAAQPHNVGAQVSYQGEPHYVVSSEPIDNEQYYDLAHTTNGNLQQMIPHSELDEDSLRSVANILDPVQSQLPEIWDDPQSASPKLKPRYAHFITKHIYDAMVNNGYDNPEDWCELYLSGSLTTYQYSPNSDVDINIFVNSSKFPNWSRAELVGIMVSQVDGHKLPATTYPLQVFVMPHDVKPADKYQANIRSGYDIQKQRWIEPPDHKRVMNIEREENAWYVQGLEAADKMESLLRYEPQKALMYYDQIHQRRQRDSIKGDFGPANIIYKFLEKRGLLDKVNALTHSQTRTAAFGQNPDELIPEQREYLENLGQYRYDEEVPHGLLNNPPAGARLWRGENSVYDPENREDVGRHWSINPTQTTNFASGRHSVIWQGTLDHPNNVWPRDHPIWKQDSTINGEHEIRMRPGANVNIEGFWRPTEFDSGGNTKKFWPYQNWPENLQKNTGMLNPSGWEFVPIGTQLPVTNEKSDFKTPSDWKKPEQLWEEKQDEPLQQVTPELESLHEQLNEGNPWGIGYGGPKQTWWTRQKYEKELQNYLQKIAPEVTSTIYNTNSPKEIALTNAFMYNKYPKQFQQYGWPEHHNWSDPGYPVKEYLDKITPYIKPDPYHIENQKSLHYKNIFNTTLKNMQHPPGGWGYDENGELPSDYHNDLDNALEYARQNNPLPDLLHGYYDPTDDDYKDEVNHRMEQKADDFNHYRKNLLANVAQNLYQVTKNIPDEELTPNVLEKHLQTMYQNTFSGADDLSPWYDDRSILRDDDRQTIMEHLNRRRREDEEKRQHAQEALAKYNLAIGDQVRFLPEYQHQQGYGLAGDPHTVKQYSNGYIKIKHNNHPEYGGFSGSQSVYPHQIEKIDPNANVNATEAESESETVNHNQPNKDENINDQTPMNESFKVGDVVYGTFNKGTKYQILAVNPDGTIDVKSLGISGKIWESLEPHLFTRQITTKDKI